MDKKILDMFRSRELVDRILKKSQRAICGTFERQINVKPRDVEKTKATLRDAGFIIIGTGDAGFGSKSIWFNPAGVVL